MRSILVTGGASGIGRAMVEAFAASNDAVTFIDCDPAGKELAASLRAAGRRVVFHQADVADWEAVAEIVAGLEHVDVAIANAGIVRRASAAELDAAHWDNVLSVNLRGTAALLLAAARVMGAGGSLIALSSTSALIGWAEHAHYNASKAGIVGLIKGLAAELGPRGIRANAILPGVIRTAQSLSEEHSIGEAGIAASALTIPLRRVGTPENVADVAMFLASPAASYISGHALVVDGGMTASSY